MPRSVPTFRPPQAGDPVALRRERESRYRATDNREDTRIRGRKGVKLRRRRLEREPLCRHCAEKGRTTPATVPDHIVPLAFGGTDTDDNVQCLCDDCHAIKSAMEGAAYGGAASHPDWLKASAIPLTIVCGPPCAGKSTYVAERVGVMDRVIDLDEIALGVDAAYRPWSGMLQGDLLRKAIRVRNAMLGTLSRKSRGVAWFIVSAPTEAERTWWNETLGGDLVLLHPGVDECKRRAVARGTPQACSGIDEWERKSRLPWEPRIKTV